MNIKVKLLPFKVAICQLQAHETMPSWALQNDTFFSITKTQDELSLVCLEENIPANLNIKIEKGWRVFKVLGPLDFALTGVLLKLIAPLADHKISIFALSTYDTDYILVKEQYCQKAQELLSAS